QSFITMPFGTYTNTSRTGAFTPARLIDANAGVIASNIGKPMTVPIPLRKVRLGRRLCVIIIVLELRAECTTSPPFSMFLNIVTCDLSDTSAHLKGQTPDDLQHEAGETIILRLHAAGDLFYRRLVITLEAASQGVGQQFLGQAFGKSLTSGFYYGLQLLWSVERSSVGQYAGSVDRKLPILRAPSADRVKVLQPEAQRVHTDVTRGASRILAV